MNISHNFYFFKYRNQNENYLNFEDANFINEDITDLDAGFYDEENENNAYYNKLKLYLAA